MSEDKRRYSPENPGPAAISFGTFLNDKYGANFVEAGQIQAFFSEHPNWQRARNVPGGEADQERAAREAERAQLTETREAERLAKAAEKAAEREAREAERKQIAEQREAARAAKQAEREQKAAAKQAEREARDAERAEQREAREAERLVKAAEKAAAAEAKAAEREAKAAEKAAAAEAKKAEAEAKKAERESAKAAGADGDDGGSTPVAGNVGRGALRESKRQLNKVKKAAAGVSADTF